MGLPYYLSLCPNNANRLMLTRRYWQPKKPVRPTGQQQQSATDHLQGMKGWLEPTDKEPETEGKD